jgi:hypothetical protein
MKAATGLRRRPQPGMPRPQSAPGASGAAGGPAHHRQPPRRWRWARRAAASCPQAPAATHAGAPWRRGQRRRHRRSPPQRGALVGARCARAPAATRAPPRRLPAAGLRQGCCCWVAMILQVPLLGPVVLPQIEGSTTHHCSGEGSQMAHQPHEMVHPGLAVRLRWYNRLDCDRRHPLPLPCCGTWQKTRPAAPHQLGFPELGERRCWRR